MATTATREEANQREREKYELWKAAKGRRAKAIAWQVYLEECRRCDVLRYGIGI